MAVQTSLRISRTVIPGRTQCEPGTQGPQVLALRLREEGVVRYALCDPLGSGYRFAIPE